MAGKNEPRRIWDFHWNMLLPGILGSDYAAFFLSPTLLACAEVMMSAAWKVASQLVHDACHIQVRYLTVAAFSWARID